MDGKEGCDVLLQRGFTPTEIDRLCKLRRVHMEEIKRETSTEQRRLEFVRWLVANGKLTDQLV